MPRLFLRSSRLLAALLLVMQGVALPVVELAHTPSVPFSAAVPSSYLGIGSASLSLEDLRRASVADSSLGSAAHDELRCPLCRYASSRPEPVSERHAVLTVDSWTPALQPETEVSYNLPTPISPPVRGPPVVLS